VNEPEIVHPVDIREVEPFLQVLLRGLLQDPYDRIAERAEQTRRNWNPDRAWGARDEGRWVGTLRTEERCLTIPGVGRATRDLQVDALTSVSVSATHRRRGLLTTMLRDSLAAAKERGDALSVLIAAEWPIYGRFGYAPATEAATYRYHPRWPGGRPLSGALDAVRPANAEELREVAPRVFAAARRQRVGQLDRRDPWWPRVLRLDGHAIVSETPRTWLVHHGPGGPDGLLSWKPTRDSDLSGRLGALRVHDLIAATDAAYRDLWAYLGGIDLISEIELTERPVDEPIRWLLGDGRALQQRDTVDFLWVRLLDVPAALSARAYAVPGRIVLDVVDDDLGGYGTGRVLLDADTDAGQATCRPTTEPADLRLSQRALASIYLGGHCLRTRTLVGDLEEFTTGAIDRVDTMFGIAAAPWNQTWF
jgi:predicted acetyltransferase